MTALDGDPPRDATISLRPGASFELRCALCHARGPSAELTACSGCATRYHPECRADAACPTLGCRGLAAPAPAGPPPCPLCGAALAASPPTRCPACDVLLGAPQRGGWNPIPRLATRRCLRRAWRRWCDGDLEGALLFSERALAWAPWDIAARWYRGALRAELGDGAGADEDLTLYLRQRPASARAWAFRGLARHHLERHADALADFAVSLRLEPRNPDALKLRWMVRAESGDLDGAAADVEALCEVAPDDAGSWSQRGYVAVLRAEPEQAVEHLERALTLAPDLAGARANRAWARIKLGSGGGALFDAELAIELAPADPYAALVHALALQEAADNPAALRACARARELAPEAFNPWVLEALIYDQQGRHRDALAALARAAECDASKGSVSLRRAASLRQLGRLDEAAAELDVAAEEAPAKDAGVEGWIAFGRAALAVERGDPAGAEAELARAVELLRDDEMAWPVAGRLRARLGQHVAARADCDRGLALAANPTTALWARATVRLAGGDAEGAVEDCLAGLERTPKEPALWTCLGEAREALGAPGDALDAYGRALASDPCFTHAWLRRAKLRAARGRAKEAAHDATRLLALASPDDPRAGEVRGLLDCGQATPGDGLAEASRGRADGVG